jgi:hypothetical protein
MDAKQQPEGKNSELEYAFRLTLGEAQEGLAKLPRLERQVEQVRPVRPPISAAEVHKALLATSGAAEVIARIPDLDNILAWAPVATFSVCQKTGTAAYLDLWDVDHFDGFTDMQRSLTDCRAWFSANGFTFWDSPQTKTGRINCYFRAPSAGNYVCNVQLQSYNGPAQVECLIDNFNFGPLPFNGTINQPHPSVLSAGYHSFRIRQMSGAFFFNSLTVWKV